MEEIVSPLNCHNDNEYLKMKQWSHEDSVAEDGNNASNYETQSNAHNDSTTENVSST